MMNNKELIEKAVYTIKETKDSIDKLNDIFKQLADAYDNSELYINIEEVQPITRWLSVVVKEDIIGKSESILKEAYWRNECTKNKKNNFEDEEYKPKMQEALRSLEF